MDLKVFFFFLAKIIKGDQIQYDNKEAFLVERKDNVYHSMRDSAAGAGKIVQSLHLQQTSPEDDCCRRFSHNLIC